MIDLDENVYELQVGDYVAREIEEDRYVDSARIQKSSIWYHLGETEEIFEGDKVNRVMKSSEWIPTVLCSGSVVNSLFSVSRYDVNKLYAIKPEKLEFDPKTGKIKKMEGFFRWFLFDKHKKLEEEFPEMEGIL